MIELDQSKTHAMYFLSQQLLYSSQLLLEQGKIPDKLSPNKFWRILSILGLFHESTGNDTPQEYVVDSFFA